MHILNYMNSQISCRHLLTLMVFNDLQTTIMILNGAIIIIFLVLFETWQTMDILCRKK